MKSLDLEFKKFETELRKELEYQLDGGTSYRQQTAKLSLEIALQVKEVSPFLEEETTRMIVSRIYPKLDQERHQDVSKFLRVVARSLLFKSTLPEEVKEYVEEKMKNTKVTIKKIKK